MLDRIRDNFKSQKSIFIVSVTLSIFILSLLVIIFWLSSAQKTNSTTLTTLPQQSLVSSQSEPKSNSSKAQSIETTTIMVDVKGAVKSEGLYKLKAGSRVSDAIHKAGGLTDQADKKSVNLAQKLTDETVVYVASQGENMNILDQSQKTSSQATGQTSGKIKLNTASLSDLQTISGIGAKRAQDIIDYREANGGFKSLDELKNVSGIGDKTLEKMKDELTLD